MNNETISKWKLLISYDKVGISQEKNSKKPIGKYEENQFDFDELIQQKSIVWWVRGFTIVDVDDIKIASFIQKILVKSKVKFISHKSRSKGLHFIFKESVDCKRNKSEVCYLGVPIEIKTFGGKKQTPIKDSGVWREFITWNNPDALHTLPYFLRTHKKMESILGMDDNTGRNQNLIMLLLNMIFQNLKKC